MPVDTGPDVAATLLAWYDRHARRLPWRAMPGEAAEPYRVWLSEIMLQQTTVAAVRPRFEEFARRWPDVAALAAAPEADVMVAWAGLGYYARARNLIACARQVEAGGGVFPDTEGGLRTLPGIGRYTAAAIAAIAFGRRAVVVDANVQRVVTRLFAIAEPLPAATPIIERHAGAITPDLRAGDFAQAMMDLGATICTARAPACTICPLRDGCAAVRTGEPERFPVKAAKGAKPVRYGTIFWLESGGDVLLVRRPPKGLLGGMRALPTGPWGAGVPGLQGAPTPLAWHPAAAGRHVFTHFALDYQVMRSTSPEGVAGDWWAIDRLEEAGLPTLFRNAARLVTQQRQAS